MTSPEILNAQILFPTNCFFFFFFGIIFQDNCYFNLNVYNFVYVLHPFKKLSKLRNNYIGSRDALIISSHKIS